MSTECYVTPMVREPGNWIQSAKEDTNAYSAKRDDTPCHDSRPRWTPFFLRRSVIVLFLLIFIAILCSLVALFVYSGRQHNSLGIKTPGSKYYYLWTYGPTAVFTTLAAGWTQVEYRAVQLMPWVLMSQGPTLASESISLDYLSNWNVQSFFKSFKKKHYLVSICIAGSLLLNAVTVFSTALFELTPVPINQAVNLTVTHTFNATDWNPIYSNSRPMGACLGFMNDNMSRPIGLHDPYVYPPFQNANLGPIDNYTITANHKYQAELDIFEPTLKCSNVTVKFEFNPTMVGSPAAWTAEFISKDGCTVRQKPGYEVSGIDAFFAQCERANGSMNVSWSQGYRLWAVVAPGEGFFPKETKAIMCEPGYTIFRGPVTISRDPERNGISTSIPANKLVTVETIANVTGGKILSTAYGSLALTANALGMSNPYVYTSTLTPEQFLDSIDLFVAAIKDSWSCIMRMVVRDSLLVPNPHNVEGSEQIIEQRLFVRPLSFWSMIILIGILIVDTSFLLYLYVPVSVCSRDTSSIGGLATVLSRSSEFMSTFQTSHYKSESEMTVSALPQSRYITQTTNSGDFRILPCDDMPSTVHASSAKTNELVWWSPLSSTWVIRFPLLAIPLAVIVALEIIYRISERSRGIASVGSMSPYFHYVWSYLPAIIMFGIRCLFQSVEFGARVFQPYSVLTQGSAPAETSILENQLRKISIYAVYDTLCKRQWAMATASFPLLLGAITPIVVSGLYTTRNSVAISSLNLTQATRWNIGDPSAYWNRENFTTAPISGMIIQLNMSYPQWTYKDLAFPKFTLANSNDKTTDTPARGYIQARLPALRARLNCHELKNGSCTWKDTTYTNEVQIYHDVWQCDPTPDCNNYVRSSSCAPDAEPNKRGYQFSSGIYDYYPGLPSYCPSHRMLWSKCYRDPRYNTSANHHVIDCNATMEEVDVDVRLEVPSFSFDPEFEPRVVKGSARPITVDKTMFVSFGEIYTFLLDVLPSKGYNTFGDPDLMKQALVYGIDGVPAEELSDPSRLISRANEIFGIVTAQALNSCGHESFDKPLNRSWVISPMTSKAPVYKAMFHDGSDYLVQEELSTRILQGLMGAMVVIAAVASLLYGSRILENDFLPSEAEWCDDNELKRRGVFEGRTFSMGWWTTAGKSLDESGLYAADTITRASSLPSWSSHGDTEGDVEAHADAERITRQGRRFGIDVDCNEDGQHLD
ncbi:hypothetical protein N7510_005111 [Penicillium lagena]|uniref:uncharacterized protein n=1 Tax=Penicillium lagena TaxID=94218 RepID=UPI0025421CDC|nr:uncharacterized protein N7510_005111 [Penicillium lagena]KAJ5621127.1 hypothetical protein N7510_005111 [Penicillium lagena]